MAKGHPEVGWAHIGVAVAARCTNPPEGIVLGWAPIGFAAMATPRPSQYYFGHTSQASHTIPILQGDACGSGMGVVWERVIPLACGFLWNFPRVNNRGHLYCQRTYVQLFFQELPQITT